MLAILKTLRLPIYILGIIIFFIGERYFDSSELLMVLRIAGLALAGIVILTSWFLSVGAATKGLDGEAKSWRYTLVWQVSLILSMVFYVVYTETMGNQGYPESLVEKVLLAVWGLFAIIGVTSAIGFEMAHKASGVGRLAEPLRVKRSGAMWTSVGMLLGFLVCVNYAGSKKDIVDDWSYLKTTEPSEFTRNMLATISSDIEVVVFFSKNNDVLPFVKEYFDNLARIEKKVKVSYFDQELSPVEATEYKANKNGIVVVKYNEKQRKIQVGDSISKARKVLKKLDGEFQKAFLKLNQKKKIAYFTQGHGELSWRLAGGNKGRRISTLQSFLRKQNFILRKFGIDEGSASEVPEDASVVVIAGPTQPFLEEEIKVLKNYVENGGSLMVFLDIEKSLQETPELEGAPRPLYGFLKEAGLEFKPQMLANVTPRDYATGTNSKLDKAFLYSNIFTSHESVASLAKHDEKVAVLVFRSGWINVERKKGDWTAFETIRSLRTTFVDFNENYDFDKDTELKKTYSIGAVASHAKKNVKSGKNGQILLLADATALTDGLIRNTGNLLFAADAFKWLVKEDVVTGTQSDQEDIKIRHKKSENIIWFWASIFFIPAFVLGVGGVVIRVSHESGTQVRKPKEKVDFGES